MWFCEDKLTRKTAHFRLPVVAQKRRVLKLPIASFGKRVISELKHAPFLSHGRTPEVYCYPILLVFTLPHLYF